MTITSALNKHFGRKEGQSMGEFAAEIRALTYKDKVELAALLTPLLGEITVEEPKPQAA